jgi:hypothetical protein
MLEVMRDHEDGAEQKEYAWRKSYRSAMMELNPAELPAKVKLAVRELAARSQELLPARDPASIAEWQAIADALHNLSLIDKQESTSSSDAATPADPPRPPPTTRDPE